MDAKKKKNYVGFKAWDMGFDAHLTVLFTGELEPQKELILQDILHEIGPQTNYVYPHKIALFGPDNDIPVLRVQANESLFLLREQLIKWGVPNKSDYDFTPHITLKLPHRGEPLFQTLHIPTIIKLSNLGYY